MLSADFANFLSFKITFLPGYIFEINLIISGSAKSEQNYYFLFKKLVKKKKNKEI